MSSNSFYKHKTVIITGGAGSVGSQLARSLLGCNPRAVILIDNNESALYDLELDLKSSKVSTVIADIKGKERMEPLFEGVDFVFHLAALKNVPMCEYNPYEAVKTNVVGTHNVIDLCLRKNVEKVIFPSTGKAVQPTTVYGATKLLAERLLTLANSEHDRAGTVFASVRFGNVLGSRGSVFPLFKRQIENGGPVTITHEEMVRPQIVMSDALRLIMNACELARGGETFIFKMKMMKITEVMDVMIHELAPQSGYQPEEIDIQLIGVKPGEKIREHLMTDAEQRRAYEIDDMFVVAPEIKQLSHTRDIYSSLAAQGEIKAYKPREPVFVTRDEIKGILKHLRYT